MKHSKGNWKVGSNPMTVVTDNGEGFPQNTGHDDTGYYGGYLIAESILKTPDAKLIAAAPDLLDAIVFCLNELYQTGTQDEIRKQAIEKANAAIRKATE